jgi:hypothetical protein
MTEMDIITWHLDATLRENIMRLFNKPGCPFGNFEVAGKIVY